MTSEDLTLGQLLRRHRAASAVTQEDLAERAGISARTVSDVERGLRTTIYRDTAGRLAWALGLEGEARAEFEAIARGRRTRALSQTSSAGVEAHTLESSGVPAQLTRLIGREVELAAVLSALRSRDIRLLALTGPGGVGKTRLAVEVASQVFDDFADGVLFVSFGAHRDPDLVASIVARAVGLRQAREPLDEALMQHLQDKQALLVLDTFEHILVAAPLIGTLLEACPRLTALVTSRAALNLRGEHEIMVPPLQLPEDPQHVRGDELRRYASTALFLERAQALRSDVGIDEAAGPLVAEICHRLDGLPLAIELAAARVKHLALEGLRDHLEHRLQVLTGGPRDLPARQRAMRDTVAWSYDLLERNEQSLFRRLSLFSGGWTLQAAGFIAGNNDEPIDLLAGISVLVDKSLVLLEGDSGHEARYMMLDVIREYAGEQLNVVGETDVVGRRHAEYYLHLAEQAEPELLGATQGAWYRRLDREVANFRAALRWSISSGDAELALRLAGALWQFWRRYGDFNEGRGWLHEALAMPGEHAHARAKALWGAAWLAYHQADYAHSEVLGEQLLALAGHGDDPLALRNALTIAGQVAMAQGRYSDALAPLEEALAICRQLGRSWHQATSLLNYGVATMHAGDSAHAEGLLEDALSLYEELGDRYFSARVLGELAYAALQRGDPERAERLCMIALRTFWELGETWGIAEGLEGLSAISAAQHDAERAARIAGAAEVIRETNATQAHPFDRVITERCLADARARVEESAWRDAWEDGRMMPVHEAIEYSVGEP